MLDHSPALRRNTYAFSLMTAAWGFDFAFVRDLTGEYTNYGLVSSSAAEVIFAWLAIIGAALMGMGVAARRELVVRIGMLTTAFAYLVFAVGFIGMAIAVAIGATPESAAALTNWFSRIVPSISYISLALWYALAATKAWTE